MLVLLCPVLEKDDGKEGVVMPGKVNWQDVLLVVVRHPGQYSYPLAKQ